jgi:type I restriction enzyme S subunit
VNLKSVTAQTGVPGLNRDRAYNLRCRIPKPSEQRKIVDLIKSMDGEISATEKLISETKQLRSGLLTELLSGDHEIPESYDKIMGEA